MNELLRHSPIAVGQRVHWLFGTIDVISIRQEFSGLYLYEVATSNARFWLSEGEVAE